jgi:hypothetical protein
MIELKKQNKTISNRYHSCDKLLSLRKSSKRNLSDCQQIFSQMNECSDKCWNTRFDEQKQF